LAWTIDITNDAEKSLRKIGAADIRRIRDFLFGRVALLDHPRQLGQALQRTRFGNLWRYRVGDSEFFAEIRTNIWLSSLSRSGIAVKFTNDPPTVCTA